jgi:hypothetical protein
MKDDRQSESGQAVVYFLELEQPDQAESKFALSSSLDGALTAARGMMVDHVDGTVSIDVAPNCLDLIRREADKDIHSRRLNLLVMIAIKTMVTGTDARPLSDLMEFLVNFTHPEELYRLFKRFWLPVTETNWQARQFEYIWKFYSVLEARDTSLADPVEAPRSISPSDEEPLPAFVRENIEALSTDNPRKLNILFIMDDFNQSVVEDRLNPIFENEVSTFWKASARAAGHQVLEIDASRFSYDHPKFTGLEYLPDFDAAMILAADMKPDMIVLDANYLPLDPEVSRAGYLKLKASTNAPVVGFVGDDYGNDNESKCEFWASICDLLVTFERVTHRPPAIRDKMVRIFHTIGVERPVVERDITRTYFSGTARPDRIAYVAALADAGVPLTHSMKSRSDQAAFTFETYMNNLASHGIVVNSGCRSWFPTSKHPVPLIVTGRVFEIFHFGAVLMERRGAHTPDFFIPGTHYAEFSMVEDLRDKIEALVEAPEAARQLARRGQEFYDRYYNPNSFWNLLRNSLHAKGIYL